MITRPYAEKLSEALGKPVIVENKPGAATILAANHVANAPRTATRLSC
jgi:tripartite-type tricarboxylate transporter receptor subunit TctC